MATQGMALARELLAVVLELASPTSVAYRAPRHCAIPPVEVLAVRPRRAMILGMELACPQEMPFTSEEATTTPLLLQLFLWNWPHWILR